MGDRWISQSVNFHPAQTEYCISVRTQYSVTNDPQYQWLIAINVDFSLVLHVHCGSGVTLIHTIFILDSKMMEFPTEYFLLWKREERT